MASTIDPTLNGDMTADGRSVNKSEVQQQFQAAHDDIEALQGVQMTAGTGADGMDAYATQVVSTSTGLIKTELYVDFDGLLEGGTAGDIVGEDGAANSHIGQITTAVNGVIVAGRVTCLETPAGGSTDVDLYAADEGTGANDAAITSLTNDTQLINHGAWTQGEVAALTGFPAADQHLYLVSQGTGDTAFTAGKFLIELWGTP